MKKTAINSFYCVDALKEHTELKNKILDCIDQISITSETSWSAKNNYYTDSITKLDWNMGNDFTRPWVKLFLPSFMNKLEAMFNHLGYHGVKLNDVWFQQYFKGDTHGWHIHGSTFTGVYYLEFNDQSPSTQLLDPFNQNEIITVDVKEGDLLVFPSFIIHRAPEIMTDQRKTIISFNIDLEYITEKMRKSLHGR